MTWKLRVQTSRRGKSLGSMIRHVRLDFGGASRPMGSRASIRDLVFVFTRLPFLSLTSDNLTDMVT